MLNLIKKSNQFTGPCQFSIYKKVLMHFRVVVYGETRES